MTTNEQLTQGQLDALHQDYLRELATETGFGAPRLWNKDAPRNFQEYVRKRTKVDNIIPCGDCDPLRTTKGK